MNPVPVHITGLLLVAGDVAWSHGVRAGLVVEDDPVIGSELLEALAASGYEPSAGAGRAERAGGGHAHAAPDLVLLDLGSPISTGVELCRRLRAELPRPVIVVLTARTAGVRGRGRAGRWGG